MDLTGILAIAVRPGLYKLITPGQNATLVESLSDGKRVPAFAHERISALKDISIFAELEDIPLQDVFQNIYRLEEGKQCINPKSSNKDLIEYMEKVLPNYDRDRVHVSDMKKLFAWYNILLEKNLIDLETQEQEQENKTE